MTRGAFPVLRRSLAAAVFAAALLAPLSCTDNATAPSLNPPGAALLSFNVDSTHISFTGTGAWPPSGSGVIVRMDSAGKTVQIAGYQQTAGKAGTVYGPEPRYNFVFLEVTGTSPIAVRSYLPSKAVLGRDIPISALDSLGYIGVLGSLSVTSLTADRITGTFFGTGMRASDSAFVSITAGSFDAPYGRGLLSLQDTGSSGGSIGITVDTGTAPAYSWAGGPVNAVGVARAASPTSLVWGIVTAGADSIASGLVHGQVPSGAVRVANAEPVLTPGVAYRVTVSRVDGSYGYREFTP